MTSVSSVNVSSNETKPKKNIKESVAANVGAMATASAVSVPMSYIGFNMMKKASDLPQDQYELVTSKLEEAVKTTGLDKKGLKIQYIDQIESKGSPIKDMFNFNQYELIQKGKNAAFNPLTNEIYMPKGKLSTAGFHELGHAMNNNFGKFSKALQFGRYAMFFAGLPLLIGAFTKTHKEEDGKPLSAGQKTTNFIRNNAGKITAVMLAPMVAEEVIATVKGQKVAKGLLSPELYAKVAKTNKFGALTYIAAAAGLSLGAFVGVKIKDKLVESKTEAK